MECPLPVVPDDGDLQWSDSHSMDSDDIPSADSAGLLSPWLGSLSAGSTSASASSSTEGFAHTGQLSPISNGVEMPYGAAHNSTSLASPSQSPSVTTQSHSTPSSSARPQAQPSLGSGLGHPRSRHVALLPRAPEGQSTHHQHFAWDEGSDDGLTVPKLEPLDDDDFCMEDLQEAPSPPPVLALLNHPLGAPDQLTQKRPRGRPRKHPLMPNLSTHKITKGRSKTGCLTCRKRKKKCDEAKPRCMNCEKNAVVCEGYPEKQLWKSGRERAQEGTASSPSSTESSFMVETSLIRDIERFKSCGFPTITMQPLFYGLETIEDRIFWKHYNEHLSAVLAIEGDHKSAFKDLMVPIAVKHQGLMHSILSLASKHIDFETPYGAGLLRTHPNTTLEALRERSLYHHDQARSKFYRDVEVTKGKSDTADGTLVSARYGQMLCFLLEALVEGSPHRLHLNGYRELVSTSPPEDSAFLSFVAEFFQYHILADELIHPAVNRDTGSPLDPLPPIPDTHPPRLLGVADGLLGHLSQITAIRNRVRIKLMARIDPAADYEDLYPADGIDVAIREWTPQWPPGDSRCHVGLLYKQMMWIYLDRTVRPPSSSPLSSLASSASSLSLIHGSPSHGPSHARPPPSVINTPPHSASTSCASSPKYLGFGSSSSLNPKGNRPNSRLEAWPRAQGSSTETGGPSTAGNRAESPPPARLPPNLDPRVTLAIDESLALLGSFKPTDPCQVLLLLPCFLVGTACFNPVQQKRVRAAIRAIRAHTGLRNADRVAEVLEEVWRLMRAGDWVAAWNWPGVAAGLNLHFSPA